MRHLFVQILDFIFPPSETSLCVRSLTTTITSQLFHVRYMNDIYSLSMYTDNRIRSLIHEAKFKGNTKAFSLLNILFTQYIEARKTTIDIIIPIPLASARMRTRGYNQVSEILLANNTIIKLETGVLIRVRNTKPQTELARTDRLLNMHDAFGVVHGERITGKHILLVDDVTTTGTTLKTAKATLLPFKPASVTCLALAH